MNTSHINFCGWTFHRSHSTVKLHTCEKYLLYVSKHNYGWCKRSLWYLKKRACKNTALDFWMHIVSYLQNDISIVFHIQSREDNRGMFNNWSALHQTLVRFFILMHSCDMSRSAVVVVLGVEICTAVCESPHWKVWSQIISCGYLLLLLVF